MKRLGRYEIVRELGHGAMGRVFLGLDPQIGREVALKTVNLAKIDSDMQEEFCRRFFHEAQAAGRLLHPGIVTIFDVGEDPDTNTPFLVMEYVEGTTLDAVMRERRFETNGALRVAKEIAEALDCAHAHGIVHRDIKPSNILLTREGHAKVTDFGVARLPASASTDTGAVLGTPHYMAPEQLGGKRVDGRTDLFALGTILYRLLSGQEPFAGDTLSTVFFQIMFTDPAPVSSLNMQLGPDFDYLISRALAKEPVRRYQKGLELAGDLEDLQQGLPPRSRAALRKAREEEAKPAIPAPEPALPAVTERHPKPPTVKTEPMSSWPLAATTLRLLPFGRKANPQRLLEAVTLILVAVAVAAFAWQLKESPVGFANPNGQQTQSFVAPIPTEETRVAAGTGSGSPAASRQAGGSAEPEGKGADAAPATKPGGAGVDSSTQRMGAEPKQANEGQPQSTPAPGSSPGGKKAGRAQQAATLFVVGEHSFREARLHFYADDRPVGEVELTSETGGSTRFSAKLPVRPGGHTLTVIAKDAGGGFDQRAYIEGEFGAGKSRHLEVKVSRLPQSFWVGKKLTLRWLD